MAYQYIIWIDPRDQTKTENVMRVEEHDDAFELMDNLREHGITNVRLSNTEPTTVKRKV